jgi:hypothetical protein
MKARFNDTQGVPHDVMTWDHNRHTWHTIQPYPKGRAQLLSEVGSAVANGAMWHNWSSRPHQPLSWEISEFIHQRSDILTDTDSAADIALLHTTTSFYVHSGGLFVPRLGNKPLWGASRALQLGGYHFDIVNEVALLERLGRYRLIILAGQTHLPDGMVAALLDFVGAGGRVLVTGRSGWGDEGCQVLADVLGLDPCSAEVDEGLVLEVPSDWVGAGPRPDGAGICTLAMETSLLGVRPRGAAVMWVALQALGDSSRAVRRQTGWQWASRSLAEDPSRPFVTRYRYGEGEGWYVAADVFGYYERTLYSGLRHLALDLVDRALPDPVVRAHGPWPVEVALRRRRDGAWVCHLINVNVVTANNSIATQFEGVAPCGPVQVELRLPVEPRSVTMIGDGGSIPFDQYGKTIAFGIERVATMESVVIQ